MTGSFVGLSWYLDEIGRKSAEDRCFVQREGMIAVLKQMWLLTHENLLVVGERLEVLQVCEKQRS